MERPGPWLSGRSAGRSTAAAGCTASRGVPARGVCRRRSGLAVTLPPAGGRVATVGGDELARGFERAFVAVACTRSPAVDGVASLTVATPCWTGRKTIGCSASTRGSVMTCSLATARTATGRAPRAVAATGAKSGVSSTGSAVAASAGVGCGTVTSAVPGGGAGAGAGSSGAGGGAGSRAGSSPSGSTYPSGSAAMRTPRWTCGCRVTASPLSPTTPTSAPSATALPRTTLAAPSWSNVTA
ncbi:MAG: hypothetical protein QOF45_1236 [Gaiellaceae bacterium]|nr:hypothetical protein [Gaiellaceae bacterium]